MSGGGRSINLADVSCTIRPGDMCLQLDVPSDPTGGDAGKAVKYLIPPAACACPPPAPAPAPAPAPPPTTTTPAFKTHIPSAVGPKLTALGFDIPTADTILSLISLPENSTTKWWTAYDYVEALHDGRGYTATIFGACSGTGDLAMVVESLAKKHPDHPLVKFLPALKKARGDNLKGLEGLASTIQGLGVDTAWREAVWDVYVRLYWTFATAFADKTGDCAARPGPELTSALTRGFVVDCALNHGGDLESMKPILKKMKNPDATDEATWFRDFAAARKTLLKSGFQDLDTSKTGDRCDLWTALLDAGNLTLARPIHAAKGYWGNEEVIA